MPNIPVNQLRSGTKMMQDNEPCTVVDIEFVKPGKGQAFTRVKFRFLRSGRTLERTFKASESVQEADVMELDVDMLYREGNTWVFMSPSTFDQYEVSETTMAEAKDWIKEQHRCVLTLHDGIPLGVTPPKSVTLQIAETDPGLKGDTVSGGTKPATLETGAKVEVPLFINPGERIRVDTRTGEYLERAKE